MSSQYIPATAFAKFKNVNPSAIYTSIRKGKLNAIKVNKIKCVLLDEKADNYTPNKKPPKRKKNNEKKIFVMGTEYRDDLIGKYCKTSMQTEWVCHASH